MNLLIKKLVKEELNELSLKNAVAGGLMAMGSFGGAKAQTLPTPTSTTQTSTSTKPMFGTPEQRLAAKAKREAQRKKNEDLFAMGAMRAGFYEEISDDEYTSGSQLEANDPNEYKDIIYRNMEDSGSKFKINLKKYRRYLEKENKKPNVGLDGMMDASFTSTSCGVSKQHAKDDKKDWKTK